MIFNIKVTSYHHTGNLLQFPVKIEVLHFKGNGARCSVDKATELIKVTLP